MKKYNAGLSSMRWLLMCVVFLAMSCEADGDGCLGDTDAMIVGCSDGCGTGMTPIGDGCMGSCIFGGDGDGCGSCAGEGCDMDCGDCGGCGDCGDPDHYAYDGEVVEGAIQVHVTNSLFEFVESQLMEIIETAAEGMLDFESYCQRCAAGQEDWDCGQCDQWFGFCLEPTSADAGIFTAHICNRGRNCNVEGNPEGPHNGCWIHAKLGTPELNTQQVATNHGRAEVYLPIEDINAPLPSSIGGNCTLHVGKHSGQELSARIGIDLIRNSSDGNTELYIGKPGVARGGLNVAGDCFLVNLGTAFGVINSVLDGIIDGIGAISCRGCDSIADCGAGATSCSNGTCRDGSGRMCQGIQLGADAKVDAGSLLQSIDPGAEAQLGVRAYLGSYVETLNNGLQIAARLGGTAAPQNLCVPMRPSPAQKNVESCRDGASCLLLDNLNRVQTVVNPETNEEEDFHLGIGVSMSGLNQVLWSAYSSGLLCLSISGEADGLDMLGTSLFSVFLKSLSSLTYDRDQPLMIQLRPQYAPVVDFKEDRGQGAELEVKIPELMLDFYTIVDQRYMRIFTLQADIALPLGLHVANNTLDIAIGDLTEVIVPGSVKVLNVEMVQRSQVQSLANGLPSLIGSLTGVLGDELIPPIEIPEIEGIQLEIVGPGTTMLLEQGEPAALGIFARLGFSAEIVGGLRPKLEPVITQKTIRIQEPAALRADMAARRAADQSFSYTDLMPEVRVHMDAHGASDAQDVEYAYRINGGPWSFWKPGPVLEIDHPVLATEDKFNVRITARYRGDTSSGTTRDASFDFVNDYTAPTVQLRAVNGQVIVDAKDNVYSDEELTMQLRVNGEAWSEAAPIAPLDIGAFVADGPATIDVIVKDPSGNARMVRRTFGEQVSSKAESNVRSAGPEGCASSQGKGGFLAMIAFLFMVVLRRRNVRNAPGLAALPLRVSLLTFALFAFAMMHAGCANNDKGAGGDVCDPACASYETCNHGVCEPIACTDESDCPGTAICMDGFCAGQNACNDNDDCEYGQICKAGSCTLSECSTSEECTHLSCTDGKLPYCDYDDYPTVEAGECVCSSEVPLREYGSWFQMFHTDAEDVVAVTYNNHYGDVMVGALNDGDVFTWTFVDGVPEGPVELPPTGLRSGVRAKGDDAGKYLSAAYEIVDGTDVLHLAYQYTSNADATTRLRYARGERADEDWHWTFIDLQDAFIPGLFPSIVLVPGVHDNDEDNNTEGEEGEEGDDNPSTEDASTGGIAIVYMSADVVMDAGEDTPAEYYSEVSVAWSATRTPETAEDFVLTEGIDQVANTTPCGGLCADKSRCVTETNTCVATATGCDTCDEDAGELCVQIDGAATCAVATTPSASAFETIPRGVGLFTSTLARDDGRVQLAYYDQQHGVLKFLELELIDDALVPTNSPLIVDGETDGQSTGDVGRWTQIQPHDHDVVIFYEDAGRAELRAARVSAGNVEITVLDDGRYRDDDGNRVASHRVGSSIDVIARESGGFDVYYQDATAAVVRHIVWENLAQTPAKHPYAVFGSKEGIARDLLGYEDARNRPHVAIASESGAYGLYTQVLQLAENTLFGSKHIRATSSTIMDVRVARLAEEDLEGGEPGEGGDGGHTPPLLECATPGAYAKSNGTTNVCQQCETQDEGTYWSEQPAPRDFYRCIAHHDSSAYDTDCGGWAFFDDSNCRSKDGADFRLKDYGTNHLCARANWESNDAVTRDTNSAYWEKVENPENLIAPQWPADFANMTSQNGQPNRYQNTAETRRWIFEHAFRYLGQLNGEPGSGDSDGRTHFVGWDASEITLAPGQTEWFAFYYNDRKSWQDRIGVLVQFDDEHMELETELHYVCAHDGGGGRPRLDGVRFCSAEGFGNKGDQREAMGVRCGETGDLSLTPRDNGSGSVKPRFSSCVADTWLAHDDLPWTHTESTPSPDLTPSNWGQIRGGIYLEGHIDCGQAPANNSSNRSGWAFVRVTRKDVGENARTDVCTPVVLRPTWFHHDKRQPYEACW